ncbi:hypothetical protein B0H13DRAFT_1903843 [Mycena leptocephala]|nr:hypothetical protein B0H13DRAFT_1903843 [Mycena leptocephala]
MMEPSDSNNLFSFTPGVKRAAEDQDPQTKGSRPWPKAQARAAFRGEEKDRIADLELENLGLKNSVDHYQKENSGLESSIRDANESITLWREAVANLEAQLLTHNGDDLKARIQSLEGEKSQLEAQQGMADQYKEKEDSRERITSLEAENMLLKEEAMNLNTLSEEQAKDLGSCMSKLTELEESKKRAKLTVEQLEQDELRRLADVEGLADKVEESEHSIATLREEKYQLQARLNTEEEEKFNTKRSTYTYSTLESPWLNRRIEKSVLSPSHAKIRVTEQNSQKKLQEHVNRLETLNSDLEQTRESAEDELDRRVETQVENRVKALKSELQKEWETECKRTIFDQNAAFAERVKAEVQRKVESEPVVKFAQKQLNDALRDASKRRADTEAKFAAATEKTEEYKSLMNKKIQEYAQRMEWMLDYVAGMNAKFNELNAKSDATTPKEGAHRNVGTPDVEMPDHNPSRQPGSSSTAPTSQPTGSQGGRGSQQSLNGSGPDANPTSPPGVEPTSQSSGGKGSGRQPPSTTSGQSSTPESSSSTVPREKWKAVRRPPVVARRKGKVIRPAEHAAALIAFRKFVHRNLGIKKDKDIDKLLLTRATRESLAAFEESRLDPEPHPETKVYSLEMDGEDITQSLISGSRNTNDEEEVVVDEAEVAIDDAFLRPLWKDRLTNLRRSQLDLSRAVKDPEYMDAVSKAARQLTHRNQTALGAAGLERTGQEAVCFTFPGAEFPGHELGRRDGSSKAEENLSGSFAKIGGTSERRLGGTEPPSSNWSAVGNDKTRSSSPYISGLPRNLYCPTWLSTLNRAEMAALKPLDPIELPVEVLDWETNLKFEADADDQDEFWRPQNPITRRSSGVEPR